jgi:ABC-type dipeptide/oligopeptide/nickel transport system permease subunit
MAIHKARRTFVIKRFKGFWDQFKQNKRGVLGAFIILFFILLAIFAPVISPYVAIDPQLDPGAYPAYGEFGGPKIAEVLCTPSWYKYLPWIPKGSVERTAVFNNFIVEEFGKNWSNIENVQLSERIAEPLKLQAALPDGTSKNLIFGEEWNWDILDPRAININCAKDLPNSTIITLTYLTGLDVTGNIEVVPDHNFASNQTFYDDWTWTSSTESVQVKYNSEAGYKSDGCAEISYNPLNENEASAILLKSFEYPYWSPPVSFGLYWSIHVVGQSGDEVTVSLLMFKENETNSFLLCRNVTKTSTTKYVHERAVSTSLETRESVGSLTPEETVFPTSGNYTFVVKVTFPKKEKVTVYLDNLNCVLYGNSFGLLGTDNARPYPQDQFSLLVYGSRVSLIVGILAAVFSTVIGLFLGLTAGYVGGIVDEATMRIADLFLVLPTLPLFIVLIAVLQATYGLVSMWNIIIVLTLFGWMGFARTVRSLAISLRERPFVEAAKAAGAGKFYIINRHIIPNVFSLIYVTLATAVPGAIITEASLSWLGLGDPSIPSWGKMLYDFNTSGIAVTRGLTDYWFWIFPPCISIALLATAFILVGFALDEILNPRLRERQ